MPRTRAPAPAPARDHSSKTYTNESDVLYPVDKRLPDNEWPTFSLYDATVYDKHFAGLQNLLTVEKEGPFPIRGRMVVDFDDESQVSALRSSRTPRHLNVELLASRMSIGFDTDPDSDGEVPVAAVWAATDYGFFKVLRATPEYQPILDKIFEAVTLYYTVMDIYEKHEEEGNKRGRLEVDEVLFRYAVDIGDAAVKEEIVDRCHEHAEFMDNQFFSKGEEYDWSGKTFTYFIHDLANKPRRPSANSQAPVSLPSPSQTVSLPRRSRQFVNDGVAVAPAPTAPRSRTTRHSSSVSARSQSPTAAPPGPKSGQGSSQARMEPSTSTAPLPSFSGEPRSDSTALKLYDAIIDANAPNPVSKVTISSISSKVYFKYKFTAYKGAGEAMRYYAQELVRLMEEDSERAAQWKASPIYQELSAIDRPMEPHELQLLTPAKIEKSLVRRNAQPFQPRKKEPNAEKPSKMPTAGKSESEAPSRRGRPPAKTGGLRLASAVPKKRFQGDYDSGSNGRASKSSRRSHGPDYDEDDFGEGSVEAEAEADEDLSERLSDGEPDQQAVRLTIDVEDVPSTRPSGPDGKWLCQEEGCGHAVGGADGVEGQLAIREHLHEHEHEATNERMKLAITEGHATGHRPIEYLLEKLKKIGGRDVQDPAQPGIRLPQPIKREHGLLF